MADIITPEAKTVFDWFLAAAGGVLIYFVKKRDKKIDELEEKIKKECDGIKASLDDEIKEVRGTITSLRDEMLKDYPTTDTVLMLFKQSAETNKEALDRVHKRLDEGNEDRREMRDDIKTILRTMPKA